MDIYPKICNIELTLMFIYIYQDVLPAFSMNECRVYSAIFLSEKVKLIQLMFSPGAAC